MTTKKEQAYYRTFYKVSCASELGRGKYHVRKMVDGDELDSYTVEVRPSMHERSRQLVLWCDCPGFTRQHYPRIEHKHVRLVLDYQERGEPKWALYRLNGNEVRFQGVAP